MKAILLILAVCIVGVYSHAVLLQPPAWWRTASRERPCGGATYVSTPSATWPVGSTQTLKWWIIALDGAGIMYGKINTEGGTDFSPNNTKVMNVTIIQPVDGYRAQGSFYPNITVPKVTCTGPNGTCTMQVFTPGGGGWYSCATLNITCPGCGAGKPISGDDCVKAQGLSFCASRNGDQVLVPDGQSALQIDNLVSKSYNQNHPNPNVFYNGNSSQCMTGYKEMLCELYFSRCGNSTSTYTQQQCKKVINDQCNITAAHQYLYDCTVFPLGTQNSGNSESSMDANAFFIYPSFILLFSLLTFCLF